MLSSATVKRKHGWTDRKRTTRWKCQAASSLLHRREQRSEGIPHSSFVCAVQGDRNTTTHNHTRDTHDTASYNPPVIPDSALQEVRPGGFGYEQRCKVAERDETLGCRRGDKIKRSGQDDDIENWRQKFKQIFNSVMNWQSD
jgi:hypothetical protein